jgi:putative peptide maturation dehydrogenase
VRVRRARFALFEVSDEFDVRSLVSGAAQVRTHVDALALLTGRRERLTAEEFAALTRVPAGLEVDASEIGVELARSLVARGLLVGDAEPRLRDRDAALLEHGWNPYAAGYHFMTQREGEDVREAPGREEWSQVDNAAMREWVERYGPAPAPFREPAPDAIALPRVARSGGVFGALAARRTTRRFAVEEPMRLEDLALVTAWVFGARAVAETDLGVTVKRTSPSGGARHAIEADAVVAHVDGLAPGLYHYDMRAHALALLRELEDAGALAQQFACGQEFAGETHVSFLLVARFDRCYWKYRHTDKAYGALLMEAGHLSQTLYLVAAELGLGAWVTAAINSREIETALSLDGADEGVLAMVGCGPPSGEPSPLDMPFRAL